MKRREFMTLVGAAATWPLASRAQADKLPTIGILGSSSAAWSHWLGAFVQRLHELGWIENRTVTIEYRWTEGRNERYPEFGAEFARRKVDIIVPLGTPATLAAKNATSVIPIVFPIASDPAARAWSPPLHARVATSPDCQTSSRILPASGSGFCATLFPASACWQS
jgi:putative tryptophan/tyrosine transport system substrate-binding protein